MKLKAMIGLLISFIILGGCSAWSNAYEEAGSVSFSVVWLKGASA